MDRRGVERPSKRFLLPYLFYGSRSGNVGKAGGRGIGISGSHPRFAIQQTDLIGFLGQISLEHPNIYNIVTLRGEYALTSPDGGRLGLTNDVTTF